MNRARPLKALIALFTVVTFLTTSVIWAPDSFAMAQTVQVPAPTVPEVSIPYQTKLDPNIRFSIPQELGTLQYFKPGKGPMVVHLQTAHGHYQAQQQIRALLHHLDEHYGIRTVLVEGSAFKLQPEILNFFPKDPKLTQKANDALTKAALVKGPELYLLDQLGGRQAEAYGIENLKAYRENGVALVNVLTEKKKTENFLVGMNEGIDRLATAYLNDALRGFLKRFESFEKDQTPLEAWLSYLKKETLKRLKLDLTQPGAQLDWPMLVRLFKIGEISSKFNKDTFSGEREKFLKVLRRFLPQATFTQVEALLKSETLNVQLPALETSLLFEDMVKALPRDFNYEAYPNVCYFIGRMLLQSELKAPELMEETQRLSAKVADKLAKTQAEKELVALLKGYRLLQKLFALELTPGDYEVILSRNGQRAKRNGNDLKPSVIIKRLQDVERSALSVARVKDVHFANVAALDQLFAAAMRFYTGVKERDGLMEQMIEKRLQETGADKVAVITGGFHSEPFKNYFSSKDYSYALISPRITGSDEAGHQAYVENMLKFSQGATRNAVASSLTVERSTLDASEATRELEFPSDPMVRKGAYGMSVAAAMRAEVHQIVSAVAGRAATLQTLDQSNAKGRAESRSEVRGKPEEKQLLRDLRFKTVYSFSVYLGVVLGVLNLLISIFTGIFLGFAQGAKLLVFAVPPLYLIFHSYRLWKGRILSYDDPRVLPLLKKWLFDTSLTNIRGEPNPARKSLQDRIDQIRNLDETKFRSETRLTEEQFLKTVKDLKIGPLDGWFEKTGAERRAEAAKILGENGDDHVVPALVVALKDVNILVRKAAVKALYALGAISELGEALESRFWDVRHAVALLFMQYKDPRAVFVLIKALKTTSRPDTYHSAMNALVAIGVPAIPGLLEIIEDKTIEPVVRQKAAETLDRIKEALSAVEQTTKRSEARAQVNSERMREAIWSMDLATLQVALDMVTDAQIGTIRDREISALKVMEHLLGIYGWDDVEKLLKKAQVEPLIREEIQQLEARNKIQQEALYGKVRQAIRSMDLATLQVALDMVTDAQIGTIREREIAALDEMEPLLGVYGWDDVEKLLKKAQVEPLIRGRMQVALPAQRAATRSEVRVVKPLAEAVAARIRYAAALGKPGSGKGTLLQRFVTELNRQLDKDHQYVILSTGDVFRAIAEKITAKKEGRTPDPKKVGIFEGFTVPDSVISAMQEGKVIPDEITINLVNEVLQLDFFKKAHGIFFDGFPRSTGQLAALEQGRIRIGDKPLTMDFNFILDIEDQTVHKRAASRVADEKLAAVREKREPKLRKDDLPETVEKRIADYKKVTSPAVEMKRGQPDTLAIDANVKPIAGVYEDFIQGLDAWITTHPVRSEAREEKTTRSMVKGATIEAYQGGERLQPPMITLPWVWPDGLKKAAGSSAYRLLIHSAARAGEKSAVILSIELSGPPKVFPLVLIRSPQVQDLALQISAQLVRVEAGSKITTLLMEGRGVSPKLVEYLIHLIGGVTRRMGYVLPQDADLQMTEGNARKIVGAVEKFNETLRVLKSETAKASAKFLGRPGAEDEEEENLELSPDHIKAVSGIFQEFLMGTCWTSVSWALSNEGRATIRNQTRFVQNDLVELINADIVYLELLIDLLTKLLGSSPERPFLMSLSSWDEAMLSPDSPQMERASRQLGFPLPALGAFSDLLRDPDGRQLFLDMHRSQIEKARDAMIIVMGQMDEVMRDTLGVRSEARGDGKRPGILRRDFVLSVAAGLLGFACNTVTGPSGISKNVPIIVSPSLELTAADLSGLPEKPNLITTIFNPGRATVQILGDEQGRGMHITFNTGSDGYVGAGLEFFVPGVKDSADLSSLSDLRFELYGRVPNDKIKLEVIDADGKKATFYLAGISMIGRIWRIPVSVLQGVNMARIRDINFVAEGAKNFGGELHAHYARSEARADEVTSKALSRDLKLAKVYPALRSLGAFGFLAAWLYWVLSWGGISVAILGFFVGGTLALISRKAVDNRENVLKNRMLGYDDPSVLPVLEKWLSQVPISAPLLGGYFEHVLLQRKLQRRIYELSQKQGPGVRAERFHAATGFQDFKSVIRPPAGEEKAKILAVELTGNGKMKPLSLVRLTMPQGRDLSADILTAMVTPEVRSKVAGLLIESRGEASLALKTYLADVVDQVAAAKALSVQARSEIRSDFAKRVMLTAGAWATVFSEKLEAMLSGTDLQEFAQKGPAFGWIRWFIAAGLLQIGFWGYRAWRVNRKLSRYPLAVKKVRAVVADYVETKFTGVSRDILETSEKGTYISGGPSFRIFWRNIPESKLAQIEASLKKGRELLLNFISDGDEFRVEWKTTEHTPYRSLWGGLKMSIVTSPSILEGSIDVVEKVRTNKTRGAGIAPHQVVEEMIIELGAVVRNDEPDSGGRREAAMGLITSLASAGNRNARQQAIKDAGKFLLEVNSSTSKRAEVRALPAGERRVKRLYLPDRDIAGIVGAAQEFFDTGAMGGVSGLTKFLRGAETEPDLFEEIRQSWNIPHIPRGSRSEMRLGKEKVPASRQRLAVSFLFPLLGVMNFAFFKLMTFTDTGSFTSREVSVWILAASFFGIFSAALLLGVLVSRIDRNPIRYILFPSERALQKGDVSFFVRKGPLGINFLAEKMASGYGDRRDAATILRRMQDPLIVPALVKKLSKVESQDVRAEIVTLFGGIEDPRVIPILEKSALKEGSLRARMAATEALGRKKDPAAIRALSAIAINSEYPDTQERAVALLGKSGDPAAIPVLVIEAADEKLMDDRTRPVHDAAWRALIRIVGPSHAEQLLHSRFPFSAELRAGAGRSEAREGKTTAAAKDDLGYEFDKNSTEMAQLVRQIADGRELTALEAERLTTLMLFDPKQITVFGLTRANAMEELATRIDLFRKTLSEFRALLKKLKINDMNEIELWKIYVPLSLWLYRRKLALRPDDAYVVGFTGSIGIGKTTRTQILKLVLSELLKQRNEQVVVLSIDDLYKTKDERAPLKGKGYIFRGPPGTHDISLGIQTIEALRYSTPVSEVALPVFDKSKDDRVVPRIVRGKVGIVIFEGWFLGANTRIDLSQVPAGFKRTVAVALAAYQPLFDEMDDLIVRHLRDIEAIKEMYTDQVRRQRAQKEASGVVWTGLRADQVSHFVDFLYSDSWEPGVSSPDPLDQDVSIAIETSDQRQIISMRLGGKVSASRRSESRVEKTTAAETAIHPSAEQAGAYQQLRRAPEEIVKANGLYGRRSEMRGNQMDERHVAVIESGMKELEKLYEGQWDKKGNAKRIPSSLVERQIRELQKQINHFQRLLFYMDWIGHEVELPAILAVASLQTVYEVYRAASKVQQPTTMPTSPSTEITTQNVFRFFYGVSPQEQEDITQWVEFQDYREALLKGKTDAKKEREAFARVFAGQLRFLEKTALWLPIGEVQWMLLAKRPPQDDEERNKIPIRIVAERTVPAEVGTGEANQLQTTFLAVFLKNLLLSQNPEIAKVPSRPLIAEAKLLLADLRATPALQRSEVRKNEFKFSVVPIQRAEGQGTMSGVVSIARESGKALGTFSIPAKQEAGPRIYEIKFFDYGKGTSVLHKATAQFTVTIDINGILKDVGAVEIKLPGNIVIPHLEATLGRIEALRRELRTFLVSKIGRPWSAELFRSSVPAVRESSLARAEVRKNEFKFVTVPTQKAEGQEAMSRVAILTEEGAYAGSFDISAASATGEKTYVIVLPNAEGTHDSARFTVTINAQGRLEKVGALQADTVPGKGMLPVLLKRLPEKKTATKRFAAIQAEFKAFLESKVGQLWGPELFSTKTVSVAPAQSVARAETRWYEMEEDRRVAAPSFAWFIDELAGLSFPDAKAITYWTPVLYTGKSVNVEQVQRLREIHQRNQRSYELPVAAHLLKKIALAMINSGVNEPAAQDLEEVAAVLRTAAEHGRLIDRTGGNSRGLEWYEYLEALANSPDLLKAVSKKLRQIYEAETQKTKTPTPSRSELRLLNPENVMTPEEITLIEHFYFGLLPMQLRELIESARGREAVLEALRKIPGVAVSEAAMDIPETNVLDGLFASEGSLVIPETAGRGLAVAKAVTPTVTNLGGKVLLGQDILTRLMAENPRALFYLLKTYAAFSEQKEPPVLLTVGSRKVLLKRIEDVLFNRRSGLTGLEITERSTLLQALKQGRVLEVIEPVQGRSEARVISELAATTQGGIASLHLSADMLPSSSQGVHFAFGEKNLGARDLMVASVLAIVLKSAADLIRNVPDASIRAGLLSKFVTENLPGVHAQGQGNSFVITQITKLAQEFAARAYIATRA